METTKKYFGIENYFTPVEGLDIGESWNGWECPVFNLGNTRLLIGRINEHESFEDHQANGCDWEWFYLDEGTPCSKQIFPDGIVDQPLEAARYINDVAYYFVGAYEKCWQAWNTLEDFYSDYPEDLSAKYYNVMNGVGNVKYLVNYHDGIKTHKDGSPFYDAATFSSKRLMQTFVKSLISGGYTRKG